LDELVPGETYQKVDHRYMNGPAIDQVFADETGGNGVLWYLSDTQNTVRDVAKYASTTAGTQATVRNHLEYNSFGNVTSADDPTTATVNDGDRPGLEGAGNEFSPQRSYTGREPDPSTGLIYYRARWYDPRIGRFISEDPIGFAAGDTNLSRYVGNSTHNAVDPSGLWGIPGSYSVLPPDAVAGLPPHVQNPFWDSEDASLADPYQESSGPSMRALTEEEAAYFDRRAVIWKQIAQFRGNNHPDADRIADHLERQLAGESAFSLWWGYNGIGTEILRNIAEAYAAGGGRRSIPIARSNCGVGTGPTRQPPGQWLQRAPASKVTGQTEPEKPPTSGRGLHLSDKARELYQSGKVREALDVHYEDLVRARSGGRSQLINGREVDAVTKDALMIVMTGKFMKYGQLNHGHANPTGSPSA